LGRAGVPLIPGLLGSGARLILGARLIFCRDVDGIGSWVFFVVARYIHVVQVFNYAFLRSDMYFFYVLGISGNLGKGSPHSEPFQARVLCTGVYI